jgi:diphthine-ammonia ligase
MITKKAFVSWSGGKESCLSLYKTMKDYHISHLVTMIAENGKYSRSHGLTVNTLTAQAKALGLPIRMQKTTWDTYEDEFKKTVAALDCTHGIFGDIDLQAHRDWVERICAETGKVPILPLWQEKRKDLVNTFVDEGFKAVIVTVNTKYMGKEWLGRIIDHDFIRDLEAFGGVDIAGEKGEYHTFVFDGPVFAKPVEFSMGKITPVDEYFFLEIIPVSQ